MQRKHRPLIDERPVHELKAPHEPAELVNKIGTSATQRKKRKRIAVVTPKLFLTQRCARIVSSGAILRA